MSKRFLIALCVVVLALPALAQNPTGTLTGRASDDKGEALPGVTVTVTSPALQGTRAAVTSTNGDFIFRFLPPGEYTIKFELQGFSTLETTKKISAAQTITVNAEMPLAQVAEEVTVTGSYETISQSSQVATTITQDLINKLPAGTGINSYAVLTAGTTSTGPRAVTISGAMSYENLFSSTVCRSRTTSAIPRRPHRGRGRGDDYGTVSVSASTPLSGGGQHADQAGGTSSPSTAWARQPDMAEPTPKTVSRTNETNYTHQATLGGFILKDRLWFFAAGRLRETTPPPRPRTPTSRSRSTTRTRYGQADGCVYPNHRVIGSYIDYLREQGNNQFGTIMDRLLYNRELPSRAAGNYTGVLSDNFFIEGQYSKRISRSSVRARATPTRSKARCSTAARLGALLSDVLRRLRGRGTTTRTTSSRPRTSSPPRSEPMTSCWLDQSTTSVSRNHQSGSDYRIYLVRRSSTLPPRDLPGLLARHQLYFYYQPILKANRCTRSDWSLRQRQVAAVKQLQLQHRGPLRQEQR